MEFHISTQEKLRPHILPDAMDLPWHLTASAVVICFGHILLIHHKRIGAWLPPGGHLVENELPHQTAVRETMEETGVPVKVLCQPLPGSADPEAFFLPQPLCTHLVYAQEKGNAVYHLDAAYLCVPAEPVTDPANLPVISETLEVHGAHWFDLSAISDVTLAKNVDGIIALALAKLGVAG